MAEDDLVRPAGAQWAAPAQLTQVARYRRDGDTRLPQVTVICLCFHGTGKLHQVGSEPFDDSDPAWMPDSATLLYFGQAA